jgi:hypothetical protein
MCGIVGSIGVSRHPILSYMLTTKLLKETESRGKHATGFYSKFEDGTILYHKNNTHDGQYVHRYILGLLPYF